MLQHKRVLVMLAVVAVGSLVFIGQAISQDEPAPRRQPRGDRDPNQTGARMADFRQRAAERMKESLGATDEEWKVLQPLIEKVQQLQRQSRGGFGGMTAARRGRRGAETPQPAQPAEGEQSEVQKKTTALRSLLDDKSSGAPAIKAALDALRKAKEQAEQELAAAQKELRGVVTVRQEASLVLMGILK